MFFDSKPFQAMESGLRAAWLQQQVNSQNLANSDTPNYKAKAVQFQDVLNSTVNSSASGPFSYQARIVDRTGTSIRPDGNNVDTDLESTELVKAYIQYSYLTQKINGSFTNFRYVLNNAMK